MKKLLCLFKHDWVWLGNSNRGCARCGKVERVK